MVMTRAEWEALYTSVVPDVYRALLATLRDRQRAEDALHDAFVEGLTRPPARSDNIAGWLFRVAIRRARRHAWRWLSFPNGATPAVPDDTPAILDRLEAGRLLALLSERQRAIVVAHYYLGLTHSETAEVFGVRPGTVSATLAQALARMRKGVSHV